MGGWTNPGGTFTMGLVDNNPLYIISAATANVNEGSNLTISVSGSRIPDNTYYWTINSNAGDFTANTGSFAIANNSGSFNIMPTADLTTDSLINKITYFNSNLQTKEGSFVLGSFDYSHLFKNNAKLTTSLIYEYAKLFGKTINKNHK